MSWRDRHHAPTPAPRKRPPTRSFTPRHDHTPVIATISRELEVRWSTDARGHLVVYRPPCGAPGCALPSMTWGRCPICRKILGRCRDHHAAEPVIELRARHCPGEQR